MRQVHQRVGVASVGASRRSAVQCILLSFGLALNGCDRQPFHPELDEGAETTPIVEVSVMPAQPGWTSDSRYASLATEIPGFGGLFFEAGVPVVYLVDDAQRGLTRATLPRVMESMQGRGADIQFRKAEYDFGQLKQWNAPLLEVLAIPGVVFTDIDETRNRIAFGVEDMQALGKVEATLGQFDVPREAVIIEEAKPIGFLTTLSDRIRPVRGGLQVKNSGGGTCTLGFNAEHWQYQGSRTFLTNSHCSLRRGDGPDGTEQFQPDTSASNLVGEEFLDPYLFTGSGCPSGRRCRYSDAALFLYDAAASWDFAYIARTASRGQLAGSVTIDTQKPRFEITAKRATPTVVGLELNKIGWRTGWTFGILSQSCVNTNVGGQNVTYLCQDIVNAGAADGDSGSPVFFWPNQSLSEVTLFGVMWGSNEAETQFVFSSMPNIEEDMGALRVFETGSPPPPPPPPPCPPPQVEC